MTPEQRIILVNREKERALHYLAQADDMSVPAHEFVETIISLIDNR